MKGRKESLEGAFKGPQGQCICLLMFSMQNTLACDPQSQQRHHTEMINLFGQLGKRQQLWACQITGNGNGWHWPLVFCPQGRRSCPNRVPGGLRKPRHEDGVLMFASCGRSHPWEDRRICTCQREGSGMCDSQWSRGKFQKTNPHAPVWETGTHRSPPASSGRLRQLPVTPAPSFFPSRIFPALETLDKLTLEQAQFFKKVMNILCKLLNTVLRVKNKMVITPDWTVCIT